MLLVEDEPATRSFLERQLTDDGFDVVSADRGGRALELVECASPGPRPARRRPPRRLGLRALPAPARGRARPRLEPRRAGDPGQRARRPGRPRSRLRPRLRRLRRQAVRLRGAAGADAGGSAARAGPEARATGSWSASWRSTADRGPCDCPGEPVRLSAKEYDLLVALAEEPDRVFRKDELLRDVWGFRSLGRTRTLDSHASRLRRKLNAGRRAGLRRQRLGRRLPARRAGSVIDRSSSRRASSAVDAGGGSTSS